MDKNCKDKPYLLGRLTAVVSKMVDVPSEFAAIVNVNPKDKLTYHYVQACKQSEHPLYPALMDIIADLGNDYDFPSWLNCHEAGQMWIGYYHQCSYISKTTAIKA